MNVSVVFASKKYQSKGRSCQTQLLKSSLILTATGQPETVYKDASVASAKSRKLSNHLLAN